MSVKTLNIYGCGGGGSKIVHRICSNSKSEPHLAQLRPFYFDTSKSDVSDLSFDQDASVYMLADADGSGSDRASLVPKIREHVANVVPGIDHSDVSIIVFTGAGGSGNIYGTCIAAELAEKGRSFICLFNTDDESEKWAKNSLDTLKTLAGQSRRLEVPFPISIVDCDTESEENEEFFEIVSRLRLLCSGRNQRLDTADLRNFFQYNRVTNGPNEPVQLFINDVTAGAVRDTAEAMAIAYEGHKSISSVVLKKDPDQKVPIKSLYGCIGILPEKYSKDVVSFSLTYSANEALMKTLEKRLQEFEVLKKKLPTSHTMVKEGEANSDGFVF